MNNTQKSKKNQQQENLTKYFVSAALNDRILNLWGIDSGSDSQSTTSLASFTLNDGPVFLDTLNLTNQKDKNSNSVLISAVTNKGQLLLFNHDLSIQKLKKPVKSSVQIKIEAKENAAPLKIYGAFVCNSQNLRVENVELENNNSDLSRLSQYFLFIVYGSHLSPKIERMQFSDLNESKITLKRDDPYKTSVSLQTQSIKVNKNLHTTLQ